MQPLIGLVGLGRLMEAGTGIETLGPQLEARVARDPADASAMIDIATLCFLTQNAANVPFALHYQARALEITRVYPLAEPAQASLRLVVIMAPGDNTSNTPVDCLLENSEIAVTLVYALAGRPLPPLPPHDVVFVAIGESPENHPLLGALGDLSQYTSKPVLNSPSAIARTLRDRAAQLLSTHPGIHMPATVRVPRTTFLAVGRGAARLRDVGIDGFPIIARPIDSQGGKGLAKLDDDAALAEYLGTVESQDFFASPFIDYRSTDGQFRKCRVVLVDGTPFPAHMGISDDWMIHYVNAGMAQSAEKRRDEERFFAEFEHDFAARHRDALCAVYERLRLDYVTVDCADAPDGRLLVFEVDNAAIVHDLDDPNLYPYKRPAMQRIFAAFRTMLTTRARRRSWEFEESSVPPMRMPKAER